MRALENLFRRTPKPLSEQAKPTAKVGDAKGMTKGMNRREFLGAAANTAAAVAIGSLAAEPWLRSALESTPEAPAGTDEIAGDPTAHVEAAQEVDFDKLNRDTAIPVAAGFVAFVGNAAAGGSLGPASIIGMSALEANRLGQLYREGGEHGKELAGEELHENLVSGALALGLAGISDLTTSAVKFEAEKLLAVTHEMEAHDAENVMQRPTEDALVEQWELYLEQIEKELADQVTRTVAVAGAIAPFSTTYTSSVVANQMKGGTARLVFEHTIAKRVIDQKHADQVITIHEAETQAQQRTNELMKQFTDLMTTLSANIQGGVLAGDPPQFFGLADQWGNWERLAKAEVFGLVNDVTMTCGLTAMWFKQAGIAEPQVVKRLADHTAELARQAGGLLPAKLPERMFTPDSEDLAMAFVGVDLSDNKRADRSAKATLKSAVAYRATFSFQGYLQKKADWMRHLPGINQISNLMERSAANVSTDAATADKRTPLDQLRTFLEEGRTITTPTGEADPEVDSLLATLSAEIERYVAENPQVDVDQIPPEGSAVDPDVVDELHDRLQDSTNVESARVEAIEDILLELGLEPEAISVMDEARMRQEIVAILRRESASNPGKVAELAQQFALLDKTTKNQTTQPQTTQLESSAQKPEGHHDSAHFFNHTGIEVRDALLTQLPAVGACAVLAEQSLTKAFSLKGGAERSGVAKVTAAIGAALSSEAMISSLADNVAAYKYGYKVLCSMIEKVYDDATREKFGKPVLEAAPALHDAIFAIALKLAEQAGSLTKLGNGPNFSQEELVVMSPAEASAYVATLSADQQTKVVVEDQPLGTSRLVRRPLPFKLYDNHFANVANAVLLTTAVGLLGIELVKLESSLAQ